MLGHKKKCLSKFKRIEIIPSIFSGHIGKMLANKNVGNLENSQYMETKQFTLNQWFKKKSQG